MVILLHDRVYGLQINHTTVLLESERARLRDCFELRLHGMIKTMIDEASLEDNSDGFHNCLAANIGEYYLELYRINVLPLASIITVPQIIEALSDFKQHRSPELCDGELECDGCALNIDRWIKDLGKDLKGMSRGLCLDCVKRGAYVKGECRLKHDIHFFI